MPQHGHREHHAEEDGHHPWPPPGDAVEFRAGREIRRIAWNVIEPRGYRTEIFVAVDFDCRHRPTLMVDEELRWPLGGRAGTRMPRRRRERLQLGQMPFRRAHGARKPARMHGALFGEDHRHRSCKVAARITAPSGRVAECGAELPRGSESCGGITRERLHDRGRQIRGKVRHEIRGSRHARLVHGLQCFEIGIAFEESAIDRKLPKCDPEREEITACVRRLTIGLLGREVRDLAFDEPTRRLAQTIARFGQAEIDELDRAVVRDHHVRRVHVAMDEVERPTGIVFQAMRVVEAFAKLRTNPGHELGMDAPRLRLDGVPEIPERLPSDELQREVDVLGVSPHVELADDAIVIEVPGYRRLVMEHIEKLSVARELIANELERYEIASRISRVAGEPHRGHATFSDPGAELVGAEHGRRIIVRIGSRLGVHLDIPNVVRIARGARRHAPATSRVANGRRMQHGPNAQPRFRVLFFAMIGQAAKWTAPLAALVLASGCRDHNAENAESAMRDATFLAKQVDSDVAELERGLPEGAKHLEALWKASPAAKKKADAGATDVYRPVDPHDNLPEVRSRLLRARRKTPDLNIAKSTFFALLDEKGIALRNTLEQDVMAGRDVTASFPELKAALEKDGFLSTTGAFPESEAATPSDRDWIAAVPVKVDGETKGLFISGWSYRHFAYHLQETLKSELARRLRESNDTGKLPVFYAAVFDETGVYTARLTPEVNEKALKAIGLAEKTKATSEYRGNIEITGRAFGVGAKRTPKLGPSAGVVVLESQI